jgi:hypothetical protein
VVDLSRIYRGTYAAPGTNTSRSTLSVDGRLNEAFTGAGVGVGAGSQFEVGGRTQGTPAYPERILNGNLAEIIVYPRNLSAADALKVETYWSRTSRHLTSRRARGCSHGRRGGTKPMSPW